MVGDTLGESGVIGFGHTLHQLDLAAGSRRRAPAEAAERITLNIARIIAGGTLGEHPATALQVFAVLAGEGVVASTGIDGSADERWEIEPGQAAIWELGEIHRTTATTDLLAAIVETSADELALREHEVLFGEPLF